MANDSIQLVNKSLALRRSLLADDALSVCRLFHGWADGIPGLVIEKLGDVLIAQLHEGQLKIDPAEVRRTLDFVRGQLGARAVYRKVFPRDRSGLSDAMEAGHHDATPWLGEPVEPELTVTENGLLFIVRPYDGFSTGLFLEHRENRRRVRDMAAGRRVLNGFAYTCGFSVAAAAGGAAAVHSVDLSARFLEWGRDNFAANDLSTNQHLFFRSDILDFYRRAARQRRRYDLIILDPPTFSRQRRPQRVFVLAEQLPILAGGAIDLLEPGGIIVLAANDRRITRSQMEEALTTAGRLKGRACAVIERPGLPVDFAGDPDYSKTAVVQFG